MAIINGNRLTFIVSETQGDYTAFAHSQSSSLSFSNSLVEATLGVTNGWTEYIPGKKTSTISFSGLQDYGTITNRINTSDLSDYLLDANLLYFQIGDITQGFNSGKGYVSEITLEGSSDNVATYSGIFTVVDELELDITGVAERLQDSDGNDILDDFGQPITAIV